MDAVRFDAWTRRRFGIAVGGMATALFGAASRDAAAGRKKKRRRRCKRRGDGCTPGGKRKCCNVLECKSASPNENGPTVCCLPEGARCEREEDCCWPGFCSETCLINSDRNLKANFGSVDPADMLARVHALPITTWNYTGDDPTIRHIGPMAQDFAATFGVGSDDRHIHPVDGQGVALAAIQALAAELERLRAENAALSDRLAALEQSRD